MNGNLSRVRTHYTVQLRAGTGNLAAIEGQNEIVASCFSCTRDQRQSFRLRLSLAAVKPQVR